jgi:hypothetical protein
MDERPGPSMVSTWDTIVSQFNFILPNDTLVLTHTLASNSENNLIYHQVSRSPLDFVEFFGPDSDFVFTRSYPVKGRFLDKTKLKEGISKNIRPGLYEFSSWAKDENGGLSNIEKFEFPVDVVGYPGMLVDSPASGYLKVNKLVGETFKLKIRAYGFFLKDLRTQWYDSLKKDSAAKTVIYPIGGRRDGLTLVKQDTFPSRPGKLFFMKATITSDTGNGAHYWIPFERTRPIIQ